MSLTYSKRWNELKYLFVIIILYELLQAFVRFQHGKVLYKKAQKIAKQNGMDLIVIGKMVVSLGNVFHIFFFIRKPLFNGRSNLFSIVDQTAMKYTNKNVGRVGHDGNTPFFKKDMIVLSEWNRYGRVKKAYRDKKTNKVIVMVSYWATNIPKTWENVMKLLSVTKNF